MHQFFWRDMSHSTSAEKGNYDSEDHRIIEENEVSIGQAS